MKHPTSGFTIQKYKKEIIQP